MIETPKKKTDASSGVIIYYVINLPLSNNWVNFFEGKFIQAGRFLLIKSLSGNKMLAKPYRVKTYLNFMTRCWLEKYLIPYQIKHNMSAPYPKMLLLIMRNTINLVTFTMTDLIKICLLWLNLQKVFKSENYRII